ncbi:MAG TPA: error-prone DNA polymerase [Nevskiaceae bacterium]|nr:error-prone DNA polymerase [Nevskiaceae bacterium]
MQYAELHCLSNFSFLRGASHADELVARARALGYAAIAITDECSMAGMVRAHDAAKTAGIQLLVGSEFRLACGLHLVLLAPDHDAYTQICRLITRGRRAAGKGHYQLAREDFVRGLDRCLGILVLGAATDDAQVQWLHGADLAGRWIGVAHTFAQDSDERVEHARRLARAHGLRAVALGSACYHVRARRPLHDVLTATREKCTVAALGKRRLANGERHLRPLSTLQKLFPPEMLEETVLIAQRCTFSLDLLRYQYPHELVPEGLSATEHLRRLTYEGARRRWPAGIPGRELGLIEKELKLIAELEYESFFLTVEDIVRWARSRNILCQGRGSSANSVVCYALGVTAVDPKRLGMLFERFISRERAEPPDIDIDFEHQRREEVMQYIYEKYGRDRAALAATVIRYRPRSAIRDVGKALGFSLDQIDQLAKSLFWRDGADAIEPQLRALGFDPHSPIVRRLMTLVMDLLGFPRHLSQHVGGFVISEHALDALVPVENAAMPDRTIIQWDKDDLESLKMLKVDCLALGMLSALRRMLEMVGQQRGSVVALTDIPDEDEKTYDMLCRGESVGVFQVESRAQMSMLPRLQPRTYYDLVVQVAIVRPGPIQGGMVHPYLKRRAGIEPVFFPKPELEKVLGRTFGVPIFQEQVMQIAMVAANFSAGEADQVRRSMAAWQKRGGLEHFRDRLLAGMAANGYEPEFAESIYQQILGFGSYGFPESHSASFALLVYASAWLKCHEPAIFCAALINSQPMGFYAPAQLVADARRNGVRFLPVDVTLSDWDCTLQPGSGEQPDVRLGLRVVNGISEGEARKLVQARARAPYSGIDDLKHRSQIGTRALHALARADALRSLAGHRHRAQWGALGVENLPGFLAGHAAREMPAVLPAPSEGQDVLADYRATGLTLRRHPLEILRPRLDRLEVIRSDRLRDLSSGITVRVAGIVTHRQMPETATGIMFVSLEDEAGIANLVLWNSVHRAQRRPVLGARLMLVTGELQHEQGVINVLAQRVEDYSAWLGALPAASRDFR